MGLAKQKTGSRKSGSQKKTTAKTGTKQRVAKMGKRAKTGQAGIATAYITRTSAMRRLQLTLKDFRRLCILKGIYPRDPKKSQDKSKTYYHVKDIQHLAHEPLLDKFREFKGFMKKVRRHVGRRDVEAARRKHSALPTYTLHHLVKERYPRFQDALEDLDDPLCTAFLFASLPAEGRVVADRTQNCVRLTEQWTGLCAAQKLLRRAFISVKGVYFEAEVRGARVTWIVPHKFTPNVPGAVDFRVMLTFLEFYETLLKFAVYKLYTGAGIDYPPKQATDHPSSFVRLLDEANNAATIATAAPAAPPPAKKKKATKEIPRELEAKLTSLQEEDEDDEALADAPAGATRDADTGSVFHGLKFFLAREAMHAWLEFVIVAGGGDCGWALEDSPFGPADPAITHIVVDKEVNALDHPTAERIQPQWVVDSFNAGILLPVARYGPGATLPPHLSPFVDDEKEGYVPAYREAIDELKSASQAFSDHRNTTKTTAAKTTTTTTKRNADDDDEGEEDQASQEDEEEEEEDDDDDVPKEKPEAQDDEKLDHIMMSKKAARLYSRMHRGIDRKKQLADRLRGRAQKLRKQQRE